MNETNEPLKREGLRELLIKAFIDGIQNFCDSQDITVTIENSAKEHLAFELNQILIKIVEKAREAASNASMLQPSHIKEALNNMMNDIMLRIAKGEGSRCLALYGNGNCIKPNWRYVKPNRFFEQSSPWTPNTISPKLTHHQYQNSCGLIQCQQYGCGSSYLPATYFYHIINDSETSKTNRNSLSSRTPIQKGLIEENNKAREKRRMKAELKS
ncbi:hypothetical protein TNCV_4686171 [Trichonephila clavipes]|nr:hypothetical protein TNCV_4686171 [Trichonephila clavipes]